MGAFYAGLTRTSRRHELTSSSISKQDDLKPPASECLQDGYRASQRLSVSRATRQKCLRAAQELRPSPQRAYGWHHTAPTTPPQSEQLEEAVEVSRIYEQYALFYGRSALPIDICAATAILAERAHHHNTAQSSCDALTAGIWAVEFTNIA